MSQPTLFSSRASRAAALLLLFTAALAIRRHSHFDLLALAFEFRSNLTAYDAMYVIVAESLYAFLVTSDSPLGASPGHHARIEVVR